jgi:hypothetical protein
MDKTIVILMALVFSGLIGLMVCVSYVKTTDTKAIADMVAKGADPQAAACALGVASGSNNNVCMTLAAKNKQ